MRRKRGSVGDCPASAASRAHGAARASHCRWSRSNIDAHIRERVVGDVDQVAVARLAEHVAPVVAVGPQLRVLEREIDGPEHRDAEEVAAAPTIEAMTMHAVDEQVRRELPAGTLTTVLGASSGATPPASVRSRRTSPPVDRRDAVAGCRPDAATIASCADRSDRCRRVIAACRHACRCRAPTTTALADGNRFAGSFSSSIMITRARSCGTSRAALLDRASAARRCA